MLCGSYKKKAKCPKFHKGQNTLFYRTFVLIRELVKVYENFINIVISVFNLDDKK